MTVRERERLERRAPQRANHGSESHAKALGYRYGTGIGDAV